MVQSEDIPSYLGEQEDEEAKSQAPYVAQEIFSSMGLGGAPSIKLEKQQSTKKALEAKAKNEKEQKVVFTGDKLNEQTLV
jgi:hypothetical protein